MSCLLNHQIYKGALILSHGSESLWEDRIGYWNKRSLERWNIEKSQRGPDLPVPANIVNVPFWRAWDADVKEWAAWKNSHESNYNILNT